MHEHKIDNADNDESFRETSEMQTERLPLVLSHRMGHCLSE